MAIKGAIKSAIASTVAGVLTDPKPPFSSGGGDEATGTTYDITTLTATRTSISASLVALQSGMHQVFMKPDGTRVYLSGNNGSLVAQANLSTPFDLTTLAGAGNTGALYPAGAGGGMHISPDGTKLMFAREVSVGEYTLSTPWDVTSVGSQLSSFTPSETADIQTISFNYAGTRMFLTQLGSSDTVWQYTLSTPWDLSTASYDSVSLNLATLTGNANVRGAHLAANGFQLYVIAPNGTISTINLPTKDTLTGGTLGDTGAYTGSGPGSSSHCGLGFSDSHILIGMGPADDTLQMHAWGPHE